ncbi:MAG: CocE/NonD family hydrolase [Reichenbachiella sp.]
MNNIKTLLFSVITLVFLACQPEKETTIFNPVRTNNDSLYIVNNYNKEELYIPMRDGTKLFTAIYSPVEKTEEYPIILFRTPYSVKPYGVEKKDYRLDLGPNMDLVKDRYIFVYQDVRGQFMSEGTFINMTPVTTVNESGIRINESTDTYDTIDWLIENVDGNNGKVGQWGISYPGFYTVAGMINSHPALVAASPQAPIADWFFDDFHHNGAFFLPHTFNFFSFFDLPKKGKMKTFGPRFEFPTNDGSEFYKSITPLSNVNDLYFGDSISYWNKMVEHPNYDQFWQDRNILPHLKNINCAVMTVAGWYDAEDLYGPFNIYQTIEKDNPTIENMLVVGPWSHGGWRRTEGDNLGDVHFGEKTSDYYNQEAMYHFFTYHLKGKGSLELPEALMFETGTNQWKSFDEWPPKVTTSRLYFNKNQALSFTPPKINEFGMDIFKSDPTNPVPFTQYDDLKMPKAYMVEDQSFVADRKDVLVYSTEELNEAITLAGSMEVNLVVKTDQGDADWIVKLIDVYPENHAPNPHQPTKKMGGYQQMIRSEVLRGRFRNSYENPEPFEKMTEETVKITLQDVLHTFKPGHKIMIQVQSTWWPLVDLNPQKYVENIFKAQEEDFVKAQHFVGRSGINPSFIKVGILESKDPI